MNDAPTRSPQREVRALDEFLGVAPLKPWYREPKALVGLGALLLLFLLVWTFSSRTAAVRYATEQARRENLVVTVSATGNLAPTNQVEVGSEQSGLIDAVYVDNNDRVTRGQPLARLDPSRLQDTLVQARAGLASAQAQLAQNRATAVEANASLARQEEVFRISGGRVPARTELDTARAAAQRARAGVRAGEAQVVQARAQVSSAETNLGKATIYSPVTGVVLSRSVDPGQTVAASFQAPVLFTIAEDLTQMKLEVKVDEADVGQVKAGQRASFTVDAYPGRRFSAKVQRIDLGANASESGAASSASASNVIAYTAVLGVQNPDLLLRPGMTATAEIVTSEKRDVLVVPNAALRFTLAAAAGGQGQGTRVTDVLMPPRRTRANRGERQATIGRGSSQSIYVLGADGEPERRRVTVGESNGSLTEIVAGDLKPGDKAITGQLASGESGAGAPGASGGSRRQRQQAALPPPIAILPLRRLQVRRA